MYIYIYIYIYTLKEKDKFKHNVVSSACARETMESVMPAYERLPVLAFRLVEFIPMRFGQRMAKEVFLEGTTHCCRG